MSNNGQEEEDRSILRATASPSRSVDVLFSSAKWWLRLSCFTWFIINNTQSEIYIYIYIYRPCVFAFYSSSCFYISLIRLLLQCSLIINESEDFQKMAFYIWLFPSSSSSSSWQGYLDAFRCWLLCAFMFSALALLLAGWPLRSN